MIVQEGWLKVIIIFPWPLYLNKQEFPLLKDAFCHVRLKLIEWFSIRRFLNFAIISLLKRGWPFI